MDKKLLFYGLVALQVVFLLGMIGMKQSAVSFGEKILLKPMPVDPTDPFRGDYVNIRYEISQIDDYKGGELRNGDIIYAKLRQGAGYWELDSVQKSKPSDGLYIKGVVNSVMPHSTITIAAFKTSKTFEYDGWDAQKWNVGDRVAFNANDERAIAVVADGEELWNREGATYSGDGQVTQKRTTTQVSIDYPINTYFVPKGQGWRSELRQFDRLLVEVSLWKGDAVVTRLMYDGEPLEFVDDPSAMNRW